MPEPQDRSAGVLHNDLLAQRLGRSSPSGQHDAGGTARGMDGGRPVPGASCQRAGSTAGDLAVPAQPMAFRGWLAAQFDQRVVRGPRRLHLGRHLSRRGPVRRQALPATGGVDRRAARFGPGRDHRPDRRWRALVRWHLPQPGPARTGWTGSPLRRRARVAGPADHRRLHRCRGATLAGHSIRIAARRRPLGSPAFQRRPATDRLATGAVAGRSVRRQRARRLASARQHLGTPVRRHGPGQRACVGAGAGRRASLDRLSRRTGEF